MRSKKLEVRGEQGGGGGGCGSFYKGSSSSISLLPYYILTLGLLLSIGYISKNKLKKQ